MYKPNDTGAPANSARSSRRRVGQGHGAPHPPQLHTGRTGPWVVTGGRPGSAGWRSAPAGGPPIRPADRGTETGAPTMPDTPCRSRRGRVRAPTGSAGPATPSRLLLSRPVAATDRDAMACAARQFRTAAADPPPPPPGPHRPVPPSEGQRDRHHVLLVRHTSTHAALPNLDFHFGSPTRLKVGLLFWNPAERVASSRCGGR